MTKRGKVRLQTYKRSRLGPDCHVYFFFCKIPKYVHAYKNILPLLTGLPTWTGISWKWANMLTELAGAGEWRLALFYAIRNFLANEIYHFSRLPYQTGCIFTWVALSMESAPYSATSACSGRLFCKKL